MIVTRTTAQPRALWLWLVGVILVLPLAYWGGAIDPALTFRFLVLAGLSLAFTLGLSWPGQRAVTMGFGMASAPTLALLTCLLFGALSLPLATNPAEGLFALARWALAPVSLTISIALLWDNRDGLHTVIKVTAIAALVHAIVGICQFHGVAFSQIPGHGVVTSTMANRNLYASALFLTLPMQVFGVATLRGKWRAVTASTLGLALVAIGLAQARATWLAIVVAIITSGVLFVATRNFKPVRRPWTSLAVSVILCVVLLFLFRYGIDDRFGKADRVVSSTDERLLLWEKSSAMIADYPLLGVGPGNWRILIPRYGTEGLSSEAGNVHFQRPHNDLLWMLAEAGLGGMLGYVGFFMIVAGYCVVICRNPRASQEAKTLAVVAFAGIAGYLTIAAVSYPLERVVHSVYLMVLCATVVVTYNRPRRPSPMRPISVYAVSAIMLVALAGCLVLGYVRLNAEIHTKRALAAVQIGEWERVIEEIDRGMAPVASLDPMGTPLLWYRGVALYSLGLPNDARRAFEAAAVDHPYHLHVLNNLGTCHEVLGDHEEALRHYNMALEISPRFEESVKNVAAVHFGRGSYNLAYRTLLAGRPDRWNEDYWADLLTAERAMRRDSVRSAARTTKLDPPLSH